MISIKNTFLIFASILAFALFTQTQQVFATHGRLNCVGMYGTVSSSGDFPAGQKIKVWCGGDTGPSGCVGSEAFLSPGESFDFDNCSCPPYASGCLNVESVPSDCSANYDQACGSNNDTPMSKDISISCAAAPLPTLCKDAGTSFIRCSPSVSCPSGQGKTIIATTCGEREIQGCHEEDQCKPPATPPVPSLTPTLLPTATPTPTRAPVCNLDCTNRPSACQGAWDGCSFCNPTSNKCEVPQGQPTNTPVPTQGPTATSVPGTPTPTPTIGVPACNTPCSGPRECEGARNGCTVCLPNRGGAKVCQTQPTPTPLPFDKNACACDGLDTPGVFIGTPTTFTAYSKLVGTGANIGMQKFITFYMYKQDPAKPNETGTLIGGPADVNSVLVSNTSSPTRYRSQWLFTDTSKLEKNVTYMVYADTKKGCVQKPTAYNFEIPTQVVLAAETQQVSFFDKIQGFISRLLANFGIDQTQQPTPTPTRPANTPTPTPNKSGNIQLIPFYPANILEKSCQVIRFQLPG